MKIQTLSPTPDRPNPVLRGRRSLWRMLEHVEGLEPTEQTTLAEGVKDFCMRNSGKGIVVLITDLMDKSGYDAALRYFLALEWDIYVIHVLSAEELDPELQGDLRLIDCEDGDEAEITVSGPLLKRYKQTLNTFIATAREFCTRRGISYLLAKNETPVEQLISGYLRRRGLIR